MVEQRIQKIMSHAGIASRRKSEVMIEDGRVKVNGRVAKIGNCADPDKDSILVDGTKLRQVKKLYFMFNKPPGVLCTMEDFFANTTLKDVLDIKERVYHVGRLDMRSRGLILLTNDGDFANMVMHPRYETTKTYVATLNRPMKHDHLRQLKTGVHLDDGKVKASVVKVVDEDKMVIELVLHEGKKHIVKRMFKHLGYHVRDLLRTHIGELRLGDLIEGRYRKLSKKEIAMFTDKTVTTPK